MSLFKIDRSLRVAAVPCVVNGRSRLENPNGTSKFLHLGVPKPKGGARLFSAIVAGSRTGSAL